MGLMDKARDKAASAAQKAADAEAAMRYKMEVNKGSINMLAATGYMNRMWDSGWQLHSIFEQAGNTIFVWERRAA